MREQRLIDANILKACIDKEVKSIGYKQVYGIGITDGMHLVECIIDCQPIIDPEMLQIVRELREKLARYEKAEQEGRLVELPCEVGRTVYMLFCGEILEIRIGQWHINGYTNPMIWADLDCEWAATQLMRWDLVIGKTVFLTREEAEAALNAKRVEVTEHE